MNIRLVCVCVLVVYAASSGNTKTKKDFKTTNANSEEEKEEFCESKDNCKSSSAKVDDGEKPGAKYTEKKQDKQETKTAKSDEDGTKEDVETKDRTERQQGEGEVRNEEESKEVETEEKQKGKDKQRKGEEERHLVKIEVLEKGKMCDRIKATNDDSVTVHLKGYKASDGSQFITTYNEDGSEGLSIPFRMGVGDSIKGLELGIIDMCVDELRRLTVPASLVRNGQQEFKGDKIPRGEDLIFEVRLLGAVPNYQKGLPNMFKAVDRNEDGVIQRDEMYELVVGDGEMYPRGSQIADTLTDEQVQIMDTDKDGLVQWEEFRLPKWDEL